ncbi:MAG TPA: glycoside hydrolase family 2 TIM barrel-domain containing protein, partial [Chryseolinea sp.]
ETTLNVDLPIDECKLWTPEEPHLYVLRLENNDYSYQTRFGMRSFEVDSAYTNRALLNGKPSFIRGTNFSIHRFFEDSLSKRHPWDTAWVRKLFRTFREMDMNAIRMVIGPAPELWYDIADEEGMMIFDEYAVWYAYQPDVGDVKDELADPYKRWSVWPKNLKAKQLINEYTAWMQERWNHPSVIVWDAQNESWSKETGEAIRAVRKLDLSNRVWDNGWSPPESRSDIREAHPYFESYTKGSEMQKPNEIAKKPFDLSFLATADKIPSTFYLPYQYAYKMQPDLHWDQPCIINEYSYLWLNRDGTATILTKPFYDAVLGENATSDQRRELYARYLAAVTEYWRANRTCIGVLYPFGLAASITEGATNDNFIDISKLEFDKYYKKYVPDAFASLGVCAELWQTDFPINTWQGTQADFAVAVINDTGEEYNGIFDVVITRGDSVIQRSSYTYSVPPYGISRRQVKIELPKISGAYEVIVQLHGGDRIVSSHRKINMFQK